MFTYQVTVRTSLGNLEVDVHSNIELTESDLHEAALVEIDEALDYSKLDSYTVTET